MSDSARVEVESWQTTMDLETSELRDSELVLDALAADNLSLQDSMVIRSLSTTTEQEHSLVVAVSGTLSIDATSRIDVSGRGYGRYRTIGNVSYPGDYTGGSYGGYGGSNSGDEYRCEVYGDFRNPNELGSGGAREGGAGGGLVRISARTIELDGEIAADGYGDGINSSWNSGGSGGGIRIDVDTLSGSGTIHSNGGRGHDNGNWNSGGGGRIAIYYQTNSLPLESLSARAGNSINNSNRGGCGSIYLDDIDDNAALLLFDNNGIDPHYDTALWFGERSDLTDDADVFSVRLELESGINVRQEGQTVFELREGSRFPGGEVDLYKIVCGSGFTQTRPLLISETVLRTTSLTASSVVLRERARIEPYGDEHGVSLNVSGILDVGANCSIDVSDRGYATGETYNPSNPCVSKTWSSARAGGSHGGYGAMVDEPVCEVYGDFQEPTWPGSGGAGSSGGGGLGGGVLRIVAGRMILDGDLLADSSDRSDGNGGAGGSIWVTADSIAGEGRFSADGGSTSSSDNAGGGGGRIAIHCDDLDLDFSHLSAAGGSSSSSSYQGGAGTIYLRDPAKGNILIVNGPGPDAQSPTPLWFGARNDLTDDPTEPFEVQLQVTGGAGLAVEGAVACSLLDGSRFRNSSLSVAEIAMSRNFTGRRPLLFDNVQVATDKLSAISLSLINGSVLKSFASSVGDAHQLELTVDGTLFVDSTSRIDLSGCGLSDGGGVAAISADSLVLDGQILANGGTTGSLSLLLEALSGDGEITAQDEISLSFLLNHGFDLEKITVLDGEGLRMINAPVNPVDPQITQAIKDAIAYLLAQQAGDGSWSADAKQLDDTTEAYDALWYAGYRGVALSNAEDWAIRQETSDVVGLTRRLLAVSGSRYEISEYLDALRALQNEDGGFGVTEADGSLPLPTLLAVRALAAMHEPDHTVITAALDYLSTVQNDDGSWTVHANEAVALDNPDLFITAWIVTEVRKYQVTFTYFPGNVTAMVAKGATYLSEAQNEDGTWGDTDAVLTSLAVSALIRTTRPSTLETSIAWLLAQQAADGAFAGDVYPTAIALRTLLDWERTPVLTPADLEILPVDIAVTPRVPVAGDSVVFSANVYNAGGTTANNIGVQFFNGDPANGGSPLGPEQTIYRIPGQGIGFAESSYVVLPSGDYELYVVVDPQNRVVESDENNNATSKWLTVTTPKIERDLAIFAEEIWYDRLDEKDPNRLRFGVPVHNNGRFLIGSVQVRMYLVETLIDGTVQYSRIGDTVIHELAGLGVASGEIEVVLPPAEQTVLIRVDPEGQLAETDETNNQASKVLAVLNGTPNTPEDLVTTAGDSQVRLVWDRVATADLLGYKIYRDGALLDGMPVQLIEHVDSGLVNDQEYDYQVSAIDIHGEESALSPVVSATPLAGLSSKPEITSPASKNQALLTALDTFTIEGTADAGDEITVYVNGAPSGTVTAAAGLAEIVHNEELRIQPAADYSGMVSLWHLDEVSGNSAQDAVGANNMSSVSGQAIWAGGLLAGGLANGRLFSQNPVGVSMAEDASTPFSVAFAVNIDRNWEEVADIPFIGYRYSSVSPTGPWQLGVQPDGKIYFFIGEDENLTDGQATGTGFRIAANRSLADSSWHYVVASYDGSNTPQGMKLYLDGQPLESTITLDDPQADYEWDSPVAGISVGYHSGVAQYIRMDEVSYWSKILQAADAEEMNQVVRQSFFERIESRIFDAGSSSVWGRLHWTSTVPENTRLLLRSRSADSEADLASATWSPYYLQSGSSIVSGSARYLEIEVALQSMAASVTPVFEGLRFGSPNGSFSIPGVSLVEGNNDIVVLAKRADKEMTSDHVTITRDNSAPAEGGDIAVVSSEMSILPVDATEMETVTISLPVHNLGDVELRDVSVQYFDGHPHTLGSILLAEQTIPSIAIGQAQTVSHPCYLLAGRHTVYVVVDPEDSLSETDEGNNIAQASTTIGLVEEQLPDFAIPSIEVFPEEPGSNDTITVTVNVRNLASTFPHPIPVQLYDGDPQNGGTELSEFQTTRIATVGQTATAKFHIMLTPGMHELYAVVDPFTQLSEIREDNNVLSTTVNVMRDVGDPADLIIASDSLTVSNPTPDAGELVQLSATVRNQGGRPANNVAVRFFRGDPLAGAAAFADEIVLPGIDPGGQSTVNVFASFAGGTHDVVVKVDPSNLIREENERNNQAKIALDVKAGPLSDLQISSLVADKEIAYTGDRVELTLILSNTGLINAERVALRLYDGHPSSGIRTNQDVVIPLLEAGQTLEVKLGYGASLGEHTLYVLVDPDDTVAEEDERNEALSVSVKVIARAAEAPVTAPEIRAAIENGIVWLKNMQNPDGSFNFEYGTNHGGVALALLAMLHSGLTEADPAVERSLGYVRLISKDSFESYGHSIAIMALQATGNLIAYHHDFSDYGDLLLSSGNYNYGRMGYTGFVNHTSGNLSTSQYGYLGLYTLPQWNYSVPESAFAGIRADITQRQCSDGGWNYNFKTSGATGSMTAAGLLGARISGADSKVLDQGLIWLDNNYTVSGDPRGSNLFYFLYGLERAMSMPEIVSMIGNHNWYEDGASFLVRNQENDGSWWSTTATCPEGVNTCFALLFLERAVPEKTHADLLVPSITVSDPVPAQGDTVVITATIGNQGKRHAESFEVSFWDGDPQNGGQKIGDDQEVALVEGGTTIQVYTPWTVNAAGQHTIYVIADPYNDIEESDESNNTGTVQVGTLTAEGFQITVTTEREVHNPGEPMNATIIVTNIGQEAASGTVPVRILDSQGNVLATLDPDYFDNLDPNTPHSFDRSWQIPGDTVAGEYRVKADVFQNDVKKASDGALFEVLSLLSIASRVTTDLAVYPANTDMVINSKVLSGTPNYTYEDLVVRITVKTETGPAVFTTEYPIEQLLSNTVAIQKLRWNTASTAPGQYAILQEVFENGTAEKLCEDSTEISIASSLETGGIAGSIQAVPQSIMLGQDFDVEFSVTNTGNTDIDNSELRVVLYSTLTAVEEMSFASPLTLSMGETETAAHRDLPSVDLAVGRYVVLLRLKPQDKDEITLASSYLHITQSRPPVIDQLTPTPDSLIGDNQPVISAHITDPDDNLEPSNFSMLVDGNAVTAHFDANAGIYSYTPATALAEGQRTVKVTVQDSDGNTVNATWRFTIDTIAPVTTDDYTAPASGWSTEDVTVTLTATDTGSGVKQTSYTIGEATTVGAQFSISSEGENTVTYRSEDNAGNIEADKSVTVKLDKTSPAITHHFTQDSTWLAAAQTITFDVSDAHSGVASCNYTVDGGAPVADDVSIEITAAGQHVVVITATDIAGHTSSTTLNVWIDLDAPVIAHDYAHDGEWVDAAQTITFSATDADSGVASLTSALDGADPVEGGMVTIPDDGEHTVVLTATDAVGHSSSVTLSVRIDSNAPVTTDDYTAPTTGWSTENVTVTLTATDAGSGVKQTTYTIGGTTTAGTQFTIGAEGETLVSYRSEDNAGNIEPDKSVTVKLDKTAPAITHDFTQDSTWMGAVQTITFDVTDAHSGVASFSYSIDGAAPVVDDKSIDITATGQHEVVITATDVAGHSSSVTLNVWVDLDAPAISHDYAHHDQWVTTGQTITFSATDADSGVASLTSALDGAAPIEGTTITIPDDGAHTVVLTATDTVGHSSSVTLSVKIDTVAPVTSDDYTAPESGWSTADMTVTLTATDAVSGVKETSYTIGGTTTVGTELVIATEGETTATYRSEDNAGNVETDKSVTVKLDKTAPTISNLSPANGSFVTSSEPLITAELSDQLSGIDVNSINMTIDGNTVNALFDPSANLVILNSATLGDGWHTIVLRVKDNAGNEAVSGDWQIGVDTAGPTITNLQPGPNSFTADNTPAVSAVLADAFSGIDAASITLTLDDQTVAHAYAADTGIITFDVTTALTDGAHELQLTASDNAGNQSSETWAFTVDTVAPVITDLTPPNGNLSTNAQPAISAKVTDAGVGIDTTSIVLTVDQQVVQHAYDDATGIVSYTPDQALADGRHELSLTVEDQAGNSATSPEWIIGVDVTAPTISDLNPAPGTLVYDTQPEITATLADNFSGIDADSIVLKVGDTVIPATYDAATGAVSGTPPDPLGDGDYVLSLTVKDMAGNQAGTPDTWTITVQTWLIFHNATTGRLDISGSDKLMSGRVHSNADIKVVGGNNDVTQKMSAAGTISIQGNNHDIPIREEGAAQQLMPVYSFADYQAAADYTHSGTWQIKKKDDVPDGIHYVDGDVKITGHDISANVTIIATGSIQISGKNCRLTSADDGDHMLLFSQSGDLDIQGNDAALKGILYAPSGECKISSSGEAIEGAVIADIVDISGSDKNFKHWGAE